MTKVGIITIHKSPNYGGSLQAKALFDYVSCLGIDCEIIDLYRPAICGYKNSPRYQSLIAARKKHSLVSKIKEVVCNCKKLHYEQRHRKELRLKEQRFNDFNSKIAYSKPFTSIQSLYDCPPSYDIYITGSDQVWNPTIGYNIEPYFLTFVGDTYRKISYASSIGLSKLPDALRECYRSWLSSYKYISVRENKAKEIIEGLTTGKEIEVVCDPTLLIDSKQWIRLSKDCNLDNYVLCFTLSYRPELYLYAKKIANKENKQLVIFSHGYQDERVDYAIKVYDAGPYEWIGWINKADIVITDSFHATLFSLHCRKPFLTYIAPTNKRGSRITNIIEMIGLGNHVIRDLGKDSDYRINNYNEVWDRLQPFIHQSKLYLKKALYE